MTGPSQKLGKATLWKKAGICVLQLRGSSSEMAEQHGALLADEIRAGTLPYLGEKNARLVAQAPFLGGRKVAIEIVNKLIRALIGMPMFARIPRQYREEMRWLCRGAGIPFRHMREAALQPDTLIILMSTLTGRSIGRYLSAYLGGVPGCTSIVAMKSATADGALIHARNMDYPAVGRWDRFPVVTYFEPEGEGPKQRYIAVTSAGVHTPGITGINENGLTLSTHFHCGKPVSPLGLPAQFIGSEIISKSRKLSEAIDVARSLKSAGTWSFVVSSARENSAVVLEMASGHVSVREPLNDRLAHTNFFHTPHLHEKEVLLSTGVADDCGQRYARAIELLDKSHGRITRETAASILADHFDRETQRDAAVGNTISVVTTVTSMVAEPAAGRFWVSSGESPTAHGPYLEFRIDEPFDASFDSTDSSGWTPKLRLDDAKQSGLRHFREAYIAFHTEYDLPKALECIEKAASLDPGEGRYHLTRGHFLMRLGRPAEALEAFKAGESCELGVHLSRVLWLFLAHAFDSVGQRDEALRLYNKILDQSEAVKGRLDPIVAAEAQRCLRRRYDLKRAARVTFDLQFCDALDYA